MNILDLYNKVQASDSIFWISSYIENYVIEYGLINNEITIYEGFHLMEESYRLNFEATNARFVSSPDVLKMMNMSLLAYLFNEKSLYYDFCKTTNNYLNKVINDMNPYGINGMNNIMSHYILGNLNSILSCDISHIMLLSNKRHNTHPNSRKEEPYHWWFFPCEYLIFEDELLRILNGEISQYEIDKTISSEVQDLMVAIELKAIELE